MAQANVNDPRSLEAVYTRDDFKRDAGRNSVAGASVLHGLRITSEPDAAGRFELSPARRQTGERDPEGDTAFLPPFLRQDAEALTKGDNAYAGPEENGDALAKTGAKDADYDLYMARVLETARTVSFKRPIGEDERLSGFRGG